MSPTSSATLLPPGHRIPVAHRDMKIFGGRSNPRLAEEIGVRLGVGLSPVTLRSFSGGEVYCRYEESIRGSDVFLIQSLSANADSGIGTNDALAELLVMIDAAKGASAHRVTAVVPWFGYSRQDKKSAAREPISARLMARILEASGADRVLTMDLHAPQIQGMFQIPVDHMTASLALSDHILRLRLEDDLVVVAPDAGRGKHARAFATMVGAGFAILDKQRPAQQQAEIGYVIGDVRGKTAIVVDDIIDTAGTIRAAADAVLGAGANRVHVVATHGVFSGKAYENIASSGVERFFVTDTIAAPPGVPSNVEIISCADVLAESMVQIFTCGSVSAVFRGHNHVY